MDKQIINLKRQNEGMEMSFKNKNIEFTKLNTDDVDPEKELNLLKDYNEYLKAISKNNRPPPQEKSVKQEQKQQCAQKKKEEDEDDQGEDDIHKEVKPVYSTIVNMEDIKRAFFNKDYDTFNVLIRQHPFKYYTANYKYASDNNGRPSYVAKNLLRGFVQGLDDYRKYFIVCFRCLKKTNDEYIYPSYWIVNSNDDINTILGSLYDDYEFNLIEDQTEITNLLKKMEKNENEEDDALIGEIYLH